MRWRQILGMPVMPSPQPRRTARRSAGQRRGAILVLSGVLLVVLAGMVALSVDLGYVYTVRTELKRATDAAALAGAGMLPQGADVAYLHAVDFLLRNPVANQWIIGEENRQERLEAYLRAHPEAVQFETGHWDPVKRVFTPSGDRPSAVRVVANFRGAPLFFGRVLGRESFDLQAESIARFQPRDIVLVLDFSASMNDDSELRRVTEFGPSWQPTIEAELQETWRELGSPRYGSLPYQPDYVTLVGKAPTNSCEPQIYVKFLEYERKVYVESTKDLSNVVVQYSDNTTQRYEPLTGRSGIFGSGSKTISRVWVKSGCNSSNDGPGYGERFEASWTNDNTR
ncbi:MAG: pilus assembly protein TadG-related protein, partial [Thermoguttaceae bacterium]|nr:pilus assembly protein TadG-related protein [Thermoguttaceae bacterium]